MFHLRLSFAVSWHNIIPSTPLITILVKSDISDRFGTYELIVLSKICVDMIIFLSIDSDHLIHESLNLQKNPQFVRVGRAVYSLDEKKNSKKKCVSI